MNITQRQVTFVTLGFQLAATVIYWLLNIFDGGFAAPLSVGAFLGIVIYSVLLIAYWRGWEYARHASVILITLLIGATLPEPFVTGYAPFVILLGPILALILVGPLWVIGSAVATVVLLLLRAGGVGVYASPATLLIYAMLIAGLIISRVITETAQARAAQSKDALHVSEARKGTILESALDCIITIDHHGHILEFNPAAEATFGYSRSEVLGREMADLIIPASLRDQHRRGLARYLAGRESHILGKRIELTGLRANGSEFPVELTITRIAEADPPVFTGFLRDITDRKEAEAKLRLSDQILQRANTLVLVADAQGDITYISPAVVSILGYEPEELLGDKWWKVSRSESAVAQREKEYVGRAARGEIPIEGDSYERPIQDKSGNTHWISWVDAAGPANTLIGVGHDITERKKAQETLAESEALYRLAIETAGAVPYREVYPNVDEEHVEYQFIGEGIRQITGYGPEEFSAGLWESITLEMHPRDDLAGYSADEAIQRVRSGKDPLWKCDFKIRARDGTIHWVFEAAVELRDEHGISHGSIGIYQDITERKRAEEALQKSEQVLREAEALAHTGSWEHDLVTGKIFNTGENLRLFFGDDPSKGGPFDDYSQAVHPDDREYVMRRHAELLEGGPSDIEYRVVWPDGSVHVVFGRATVVRDESGQPIRVYGTNVDVTERRQAEEKIERQIRQLSALHEIDQAISGSADIRVALDVFLRQVGSQLNADAAAILLLKPHMQTLEYAAGRGFRSQAVRQTQLRVDQSFAGRAVLERHTVHIPNFMAANPKFVQPQFIPDEDFIDYYAVPLIAKGQVKGVLEIFHRSLLSADADWLEFLETLGGQAAIAIDNAELFDSLQRSNTDLILAYDATIEGWSHALDLRDKETEGHTQRVTELTLKLARTFDLAADKLLHARRGALLHDIGKMGVPDGILLKPGPLTDAEWVAMKKHPTFAYDMLAPIQFLRPALDIPYCHHEKWDGTGYPRGLKGEQIPLSARIFAVVDVWDAVTSDRPYRPAWTKAKALKHIKEGSGKHFDPQVVEAFLKMIADK